MHGELDAAREGVVDTEVQCCGARACFPLMSINFLAATIYFLYHLIVNC